MVIAQEPLPTGIELGQALDVAAILVATVLGVLAVWAAFRAARPRRRLYVSCEQVPLLRHDPVDLANQIEVQVRRLGQNGTVRNPYIVTLTITSKSDRDIPKNLFDGEPLKVDFGTPVIALLKGTSSSERKAVGAPKAKTTDTAVLIGPALITRSHVLQFTMLVDGVPEVTLAGAPADVHVHYESVVDSYAGMERRRFDGADVTAYAIVVSLVLLASLVISTWLAQEFFHF